MNSHRKHWRSVRAMVGIIVGLAIVPRPGALADGQQPEVFPAQESVFGLTYGDWSAAWWQYVLSTPTGTNPVLDTTGTNCAVGQSSGPVFFLAGAATTDPVTRTCTIPAGKALLVPMITAECSTVEAPRFLAVTGRSCAPALRRSWMASIERRYRSFSMGTTRKT
jgi:hypothetical protein